MEEILEKWRRKSNKIMRKNMECSQEDLCPLSGIISKDFIIKETYLEILEYYENNEKSVLRDIIRVKDRTTSCCL